jgi:DNA-binding protein YbaB
VEGLGGLLGGGDPEGFDLDALLSGVHEFQTAVAQSAQRMALETADAWSDGDLVRVWVNAQGVVVQVEFDDRLLADASGPQAAAAVVQAAQAAAAKMRAKTDAFQSGLWQQVSQLGVNPITEFDEFAATQPDVPLSAPGSRERRAIAETLDSRAHDDDRGEYASEQWRLTIRDQS